MDTGIMFEHDGTWKRITEAEYVYGGLAVRVDTLEVIEFDGEERKCWAPDAVVSVNLTGHGISFPEGEFAVVAHKLPAPYLEAVREAGGYVDTGKTVSYGFGPIVNPVWRKG